MSSRRLPASLPAPLRTWLRRLAIPAAVSLALAPPLLPCSMSGSDGSTEPRLGPDGLLHWTVTRGRGSFLAGRDFDWFWVTGGMGLPVAEEMAGPAVIEGAPLPLGMLPDGRAWWKVECPDRDPPKTVACDSLLLVDAAGMALGRVSRLLDGEVTVLGDGTLRAVEVVEPASTEETERGTSRDAPALRVVRVWRGSPLPLDSVRAPADNGHWHDEWSRRAARWPRDGWELEWQARLPFPVPRNSGRIPFELRGDLFAALVASAEEVRVGVWDVRGEGRVRQLEPRWEASFPHARNGQATDENGNLALAFPGSFTLSSRGELAMGNWSADPFDGCSGYRPRGYLVFSDDGALLADVRAGEFPLGFLVFDGDDRLVVGSGGVRAVDLEGNLLAQPDWRPPELERREEELQRRLETWDPDAPISDWVDLYHRLVPPWPAETVEDRARRATIRTLVVEHWPEIDPVVPDDVWIELAARICARHPDEAPGAALERFARATHHDLRRAWLEVLPDCVSAPPPAVRSFAEELRARQDPTDREVAEKALPRWPP